MTTATLRTYFTAVQRHTLFRVVVLLLLVKAVYLAVTFIFLVNSDVPNVLTASHWWRLWSHWDSWHYISIAIDGYQLAPPQSKLIAFLPLYPALIRIGSLFFSPQVAAILIANVASFIGWLLFYELGRREYGAPVAWRGLLALLLFPTAYFFSVPYTESVFLLFSVAAWFFARRGQWLWAGILGGLAAATRITGVFLFPALVVEWWLQRRETKRPAWSGLWLLFIPFYFGLYVALNYALFDDPLAFMAAASEWSKEFAWPWEGLWRRWHASSLTELGLMKGVAELAAGILLIIGATWSWFRLRASYALYITLTAFMVLSTSFLQSTPRYLLTIFPLFYLVGRYPQAKWLAVPSVALLTFFTLRWLGNYWTF